jgi:hypothetical protein
MGQSEKPRGERTVGHVAMSSPMESEEDLLIDVVNEGFLENPAAYIPVKKGSDLVQKNPVGFLITSLDLFHHLGPRLPLGVIGFHIGSRALRFLRSKGYKVKKYLLPPRHKGHQDHQESPEKGSTE